MSEARPRRWRTLLLVLAIMLAAAPLVNWQLQLTPEDSLSFPSPAAASRAPEVAAHAWHWLDTGIETIPALETMEQTTLDFSPDGRRLAALWSDGVRVFDTATRARIAWLPLVKPRSADFTADGRALIVSCADHLETWSFDPLTVPARWRENADGGELALNAGRHHVLACAGAWDAEVLDLEHADTHIALHHPQSAQGRTAFVCSAGALSPDGSWVAGGASTLRAPCVWDPRTCAVLRAELYAAPGQPRTHCAADPRGRFLAVSDRLGFHVFSTGDWRAVFACSAETDDMMPNALTFSPDGCVLALPIARRVVRLLSTDTWKTVAELTPPEPLRVAALAFSPGGDKLAAAALDGSAGWWTLNSAVAELHVAAFETDPRLRPGVPETFRPSTNRAGCLDLAAFFNTRLDDTWLHNPDEPGNDLSDLPVGSQEFGGVWFDVRGIVQLASADLREPYPAELRRLPVGCKCARLHFLHGCAFGAPDAAVIGEYVIHFADGTSATESLHYGWELSEWWSEPVAPGRPAVLAWTGSNAASRAHQPPAATHLYRLTWTNPRPGVAIASLDFCSAMSPAAPFLLGISTDEAEK